jgi:hypothetical protein
LVVGEAMAIVRAIQHSAPLQYEHYCHWQVDERPDCFGEDGCTYWAGQRECHEFDGEPEYCLGGFALCTDHLVTPTTTCEPLDPIEQGAPMYTRCYNRTRRRYGYRLEIAVVDLSNPALPQLRQPIILPAQDEAVGWLAQGTDLWVSSKSPAVVPDDPRHYVRYFVRQLDFLEPSQPAIGPAINVPGELLDVRGHTLYTHDRIWGEEFIESAIAQVQLIADSAYLRNYYELPARKVNEVQIGPRGLVSVSHQHAWRPVEATWDWPPSQKLTHLQASLGWGGAGSFSLLASDEMPKRAQLRRVVGHTALLEIPGGVLTVNLANPRQPELGGFVPTVDWPTDILLQRHRLLMSSRYYGVLEWPVARRHR